MSITLADDTSVEGKAITRAVFKMVDKLGVSSDKISVFTLIVEKNRTDPKGSLAVETGQMLRRKGYRIKIFNTIDFSKSMKYNPFVYIRDEKDILKFVTILIANTTGESKGGDDFWVKAETLLYQALIGLIIYELDEESKNMNTLVSMIGEMKTSEEDENFKNPIDFAFEDLEKRSPNHFAVMQFRNYKLTAGVVR